MGVPRQEDMGNSLAPGLPGAVVATGLGPVLPSPAPVQPAPTKLMTGAMGPMVQDLRPNRGLGPPLKRRRS